MKTIRKPGGTGLAMLLALSAAHEPSTVLAAETEIGAVTIRAYRPVEARVGRTSSGVPVISYELTHKVSFDDLDLASAAGADALRQRVREAAAAACADLDKMYPLVESDRDCANKAAKEAMAEAEAAIAAARTR